jgi:hypothetical protein
MASFVENIEEFSSKKLLENPEKSKITSTIELCHKKLVGEIYKQLTEQYSFDSVKIQELND